jgi:hypothetical protein
MNYQKQTQNKPKTNPKQTQTKPILHSLMAGKIALSAVEGPVVSSVESFILGFCLCRFSL